MGGLFFVVLSTSVFPLCIFVVILMHSREFLPLPRCSGSWLCGWDIFYPWYVGRGYVAPVRIPRVAFYSKEGGEEGKNCNSNERKGKKLTSWIAFGLGFDPLLSGSADWVVFCLKFVILMAKKTLIFFSLGCFFSYNSCKHSSGINRPSCTISCTTVLILCNIVLCLLGCHAHKTCVSVYYTCHACSSVSFIYFLCLCTRS